VCVAVFTLLLPLEMLCVRGFVTLLLPLEMLCVRGFVRSAVATGDAVCAWLRHTGHAFPPWWCIAYAMLRTSLTVRTQLCVHSAARVTNAFEHDPAQAHHCFIRCVCRCQGGNNAGHTIKIGTTTYDFHVVPSGIVSPHCMSVSVPSCGRAVLCGCAVACGRTVVCGAPWSVCGMWVRRDLWVACGCIVACWCTVA
jgi:hypothetical protein